MRVTTPSRLVLCGCLVACAAVGAASQDLGPPPTWDPEWHPDLGDEFRILHRDTRKLRLLRNHNRLPWSIDVRGFTVSYGDEALDIWRTSPPRRANDPFADERAYHVQAAHLKLVAGELVSEDQIETLATWLLETEAVAVQAPDGHFVRRLRVLEYSYNCVHRGGCGSGVRAFYLPGGALWFHRSDWVS